MSITLTAYPAAFLISPVSAKQEKLRLAADEKTVNKKLSDNKLKSIRILTNIEYSELSNLMSFFGCKKLNSSQYILQSGLKIEWKNNAKYVEAILSGQLSPDSLQSLGEEFFNDLDNIAKRNVRLINSNEYFYYNYETEYKKIPQIYEALKQQKANGIFTTSDNEVVAELDGQSVKYYLPEGFDNYFLEVEQKVQILNIGLNGDYEGRNVTFGLTDLCIRTNIKPNELKLLLKKSNYLLYVSNMQTPLKTTDATLNWILENGYYTAQFSGTNNSAITKEAETIFRKLNVSAGRDLRFIDDVSTTVYTYKTNYTDKTVLLNTLIEHGAEEILEQGGEVSCKLFGMEMVYYKKGDENGYTLDITRVSDKAECEELIDELNDEYGLNIQELTYNKIKERLDKSNMRIMSETVEDDNSIVLTIEI